MTIIYWTASWLMGIWLAATWQLSWLGWLVLGALGLLSILVLRRQPKWRLGATCLVMLCLGVFRYQIATPAKADHHIANFTGSDEALITGIVGSEPDVRENYTNLIVEAESLLIENGSAQPVTGKVLVRAERYPAIAYGSRLQLKGALRAAVFPNSSSYQQYLARHDVFSTMNRPEIVVLDTGLGNPFYSALLAIKARAQTTIKRLFPEPQAALLSGILLGYDRGLPKALMEDFQATGTTHIIAISGFNIAIIAGILLRGSRYFVSPRMAGVIAVVGIALYTILVGTDPAVVRAAIMGVMFIVALIFLGRPTFLYASLFAAALLVTLVNPLLLWDVGFQLSFMAVLGLMLYVGPWSKQISDKLEPRVGESRAQQLTHMIADVSLATLAAIVMTLPVMLLHFDRISLVSPIANLLILPAQPGVMMIGGAATILGMISPILGKVPAWAAWLLLTYTINLVRFFADLPFSSVEVSIPVVGVFAYLGVIIAMTWNSKQKKGNSFDILDNSLRSRLLRVGIVIVVFLVALVGIWIWSQPDGTLHVTFLDVGQGDAIFIETPDGRQIVVDGGRYPSLFLDKLGQEMPFWDRDLDIVVATHGDEDHILGLVEALGRYEIDRLLINGAEAAGSASYEALLEAAHEEQIPIQRAMAREIIDLGDGTWLEILHPGPELDTDDRNENSVSLRVVYGDFAVLLTGDAEEGAEREMMANGRPLQSAVFKAGHHGSRSSSSRAFLEAVRPQIVIISAGKENKYDHPHLEVLQRAEEIGATVLRTDEMGSVEIISDGQSYWWELDQ